MPLNRGVLSVSSMELDGQRITTCVIEEAFGQAVVSRGPFRLKCAGSDKVFVSLAERVNGKPPDVRAAGKKLYDALVAHETVRQVFARTQDIPTPPTPPPIYPLFVRIEAPEVENLPWEILFRESFIALDRSGRWPIARLAALPMRPNPLKRIISPQLRMAFVLAAQGVRGINEWMGISTALDSFPFPVNALVMVSEEEVLNAVTADISRWGPNHKVEVVYTGGDATSLISRIRTYLPNIIHVFSHGTADASPRLEVETKADREAAQGDSTIVLEIDAMKVLAEMGSLWLIVLNCCRGGRGTALLHSFAQQLVAAGAPAVVAMRESVDVIDANLFTGQFYADLLVQLKPIFTARTNMQPGTKVIPFPELTWLRAMHGARRQLLDATQRQPETSIEWSYPVLYVHRDELELLPREPKFSQLTDSQRRELVAELDFLRETRSALDSLIDEESAEQRSQLDRQIEQVQLKIAG